MTELLLNNLEILELILIFNLISGCLSVLIYMGLLKAVYIKESKHRPYLKRFTFKKIYWRHRDELWKVFLCNWLLILFLKNTYSNLINKRN